MPSYTRRLTVDHTRVGDVDLSDFAVLVELRAEELRRTTAGGHVAVDHAGDVHFSLPDGTTRLSHEMASYDGDRGELSAWVRLPRLSCTEDTSFLMHYGGSEAPPSGEAVWDPDCELVIHRRDIEAVPSLPPPDGIRSSTDAISVSAWVHTAAHRPEAMQSLVSVWEPLASFDTFNAFDASVTDGLDTTGFYGAVFDGRYVYYCPIRSLKSDRESVHGNVLRYDTQQDFHDPASYEGFDASNIDGLRTVCYYGATFDGRYVIFTPRDTGSGYHSRVLRYDTHRNFKDSASWNAYDAELEHSHQSAGFDGRYIYFCPGYVLKPGDNLDGSFGGKLLRLDTRGDFKDPTSYTVFDTEALSEGTVCYDGAAFDGRHVYFVPLGTKVVLRYDTTADFSSPDSWQSHDATGTGMGANVGAVFDGRYLYFCAYANSNMVRYDTRGAFDDEASWVGYDAADTDGLDTGGFDGGFYDGVYVYYVPYQRQVAAGEDKSMYHSNYLRYDTRLPFADAASWCACDASGADGLVSVGYNAGAYDGRFFYAAPVFDPDRDKMHGRVLRYDTIGTNGSFALRYCDYGHNGGLCAAVPGPSFTVNTVRGVLSIAAHRALLPGWHHLAGVYDGRTIKLFVDGALVAERSGSGALQVNDIPLTIGHIAGGCAAFDGDIHEVRLSGAARSYAWIRTEYHNLADSKGFVRCGPEAPTSATR